MQTIKEHKRKRQQKNRAIELLGASFLGIVICAIGMGINTYAWFTAYKNTSVQSMQTATYSIDVIVKLDSQDGSVVTTDTPGVYIFNKNQKYHITLKRNPSSTATEGYGIIQVDGVSRYRTAQMNSDYTGEITFILTPEISSENATYSFIGVWGIWDDLVVQDNIVKIENGDVLSTAIEENGL